jgi:hypothetical protein
MACILAVSSAHSVPVLAGVGAGCTLDEKTGDLRCPQDDKGTVPSTGMLANPTIPDSTYKQSNPTTGDGGLVYTPSGAGCGADDNPTLTASGAHMDENGVVTVNVSGSNYQNGMSVVISGATPAAYNGTFAISNVTSSSFTYRVTPPPSQQPGGAISIHRDTSQEQQTCIDDMQTQLDQLEQEISTLEKILSENGSDLAKMMDNMNPEQQKDFTNELQKALQALFGNPNNTSVGTNPLSSLLSGQPPGVQQALQQALAKAGVQTNAQKGELPTVNNTPASADTGCTLQTVTLNGKTTLASRVNGENYFGTGTTRSAGEGNTVCGNGWGEAKSQAAVCISQNDGAGGGFCSGGVTSVLTTLGYPTASTAEARNYGTTLASKGWVKLDGAAPTTCPPGGVLVYGKDAGGKVCSKAALGRPATGHECGHVEIVTETGGKRLYVSDKPRENYGGSVPKNFIGCWVYPGQTHKNGNYAKCTKNVP